MRCPKCNQENEIQVNNCNFCGAELIRPVRTMSRQERDTFDGVTIDDEVATDKSGGTEEPYKQQEYYQAQSGRVHVRSFKFGSTQSTLKSILFGLVILAFVFLVVPTFIMLGLAVFAIWFVFNLFT